MALLPKLTHRTKCTTFLLTTFFALAALVLALAVAPAARADVPDTDYQGGSIPIVRLTFTDDVDESGTVILSGDEKITLMNESANHEYKAEGVYLDLEVPPSYDNPEEDLWDGVSGYTGEENLSLEFIRGRGNSTWRAGKKPYKIKFDSKANLFGMGKNKHWALIANMYDESLTIDRLVGWIGEQMGFDFTPRGVPVDLFMNGKYYGSYLLMEEVRADDNRVEIDVVDEDMADLSSLDITGDYLIGVSRKPTALPYEYFVTSRGHAFTWEEPEYGIELNAAEEAQQAYIKSYLERVEDAIYGENFTNSQGDYVWDLIDMDTLADYWFIQEFTTNPDAFATPSTYFYKLRDTVDANGNVTVGKMYWGPLWDFDFVYGKLYEEGFENTEAPWVLMLRQDPAFVAKLKESWSRLDAILERVTEPGGLLDGYLTEMTESWNADQVLWPSDDDRWDCSSFEAVIEDLRAHIEARRAWINGHLDELQTSFNHVTFMDGDEVLDDHTVRTGEAAWAGTPAAPEKEGMLFLGWFTKDGVEYDSAAVVLEDMVYYATYVSEEDAIKATEIFFAQDEIWTRWGSSANYEVYPSDAQDCRIEWTSSDESVVRVEDGFIIPAPDIEFDESGTASATVTARLVGSGAEASVRVVVYSEYGMLQEPESITFDPELTVEVGEHARANFTTEPAATTLNEDFDLRFEVEDESVATVSYIGVVTGVAPGTTTVKVLRQNRTDWEYEVVAEFTVTVEEPAATTFSITFDLGGGTINGNAGPIVVECTPGQVITMPEAPVREGYTFLYWKGSEYQPGDEYTVVDDHLFTAEWEKDAEPEPGGDTPVTPGGDTPVTPGGDTPVTPGNNGNNGGNNQRGGTPGMGDASCPLAALVAAACVACAAGATLRRRANYTT